MSFQTVPDSNLCTGRESHKGLTKFENLHLFAGNTFKCESLQAVRIWAIIPLWFGVNGSLTNGTSSDSVTPFLLRKECGSATAPDKFHELRLKISYGKSHAGLQAVQYDPGTLYPSLKIWGALVLHMLCYRLHVSCCWFFLFTSSSDVPRCVKKRTTRMQQRVQFDIRLALKLKHINQWRYDGDRRAFATGASDHQCGIKMDHV